MKTALTIIILIIFGFMYVEIENMIEAKTNDLTNLLLWWALLIIVVCIRFRKEINE